MAGQVQAHAPGTRPSPEGLYAALLTESAGTTELRAISLIPFTSPFAKNFLT